MIRSVSARRGTERRERRVGSVPYLPIYLAVSVTVDITEHVIIITSSVVDIIFKMTT